MSDNEPHGGYLYDWELVTAKAFDELEDVLPYASPYTEEDFFSMPGPVASFEEERLLIGRLKALSPWPTPRHPDYLLVDGFNITDLLGSPSAQLRVHRDGQISIWTQALSKLDPSWLMGDAAESELRGQLASIHHNSSKEQSYPLLIDYLQLKCASGLTIRQMAERTGQSMQSITKTLSSALSILKYKMKNYPGEWRFLQECRFSHKADLRPSLQEDGLSLEITDGVGATPVSAAIQCSSADARRLQEALGIFTGPPYVLSKGEKLGPELHGRMIEVEGEAERKHGGSMNFDYRTMLIGCSPLPADLYLNPAYDATIRVRIRGLFLSRPEGGYEGYRGRYPSQLFAFEAEQLGKASFR